MLNHRVANKKITYFFLTLWWWMWPKTISASGPALLRLRYSNTKKFLYLADPELTDPF